MANRSASGNIAKRKLPFRRLRGMRDETRERVLGVDRGDGVRVIPTRAEQNTAKQGSSKEAQG